MLKKKKNGIENYSKKTKNTLMESRLVLLKQREDLLNHMDEIATLLIAMIDLL